MIANQYFPGAGNGGGEELRAKGHEEIIWGDENVQYFDCDGVYTSIHICQNGTLKWILLYVNSTFVIESDSMVIKQHISSVACKLFKSFSSLKKITYKLHTCLEVYTLQNI